MIMKNALHVVALCGVPSHAFSPSATAPMLGFAPVRRPRAEGYLPSLCHRRQPLPCLGMAEDDDVGGTAWIKKAMGTEAEEHASGSDRPECDQKELDDMERLVSSLATDSDDKSRRDRLASVFEEGLATNPDRFARLFQGALNGVGEKTQADARAVAAKQQQQQTDDGNVAEEGGNENDGAQRQKSPEELRLWALIDMMVQSKTLIKLHDGSMGSKGEFR